MKKDFIIIPTYNERKNMERLIPAIFNLYPDINVLVADDNSPDGTLEEIKILTEIYQNLSYYSRPRKLGLAGAYLDSFRKLLKENNKLGNIITMDADFSHAPEVIKEMLAQISGYDLILGSRYIKGGGVKNWSLARRMLSRTGNMYARAITGMPIYDLTTGFQCFKAELLKKYDFSKIQSTGYAFLIEMKVAAYKLGGKIKEIPITFNDRTEGKSKLSNRIIYEGLIAPWKIRFSEYSGAEQHGKLV